MPELPVSMAKSQICSALGVSEPYSSHTFRPTNLDIEALPFARLRGCAAIPATEQLDHRALQSSCGCDLLGRLEPAT